MVESQCRRLPKLACSDSTLATGFRPECPTATSCSPVIRANTELCGVVGPFSYATMFSIHGIVDFADRVERIAYNALPATWASPTGGDMWAHQYLQAVNEINAIRQIRIAVDPMMATWPKPTVGTQLRVLHCQFSARLAKAAHNLVFRRPDDGAVVAGYLGPCHREFTSKLRVDVETDFPFGTPPPYGSTMTWVSTCPRCYVFHPGQTRRR